MQRFVALVLLALAAASSACSSGSEPIDAALCPAFVDVTDPDAPASTTQRTDALLKLGNAFPDSSFGELGTRHRELERGFEAATSEQAAFAVGLRFATAMHDLADRAPVGADVAEAVRTSCPEVDVRVLREGADGFQPEPTETTTLVEDGAVAAFVDTLVAAHEASGGNGCGVLARELGFEPAAAAPHLNADTWSAEIGCAFLDGTGTTAVAVVAVDGRLHPALMDLAATPGEVRPVRALFGLAEASGVAAFDADADGWLVAVTPTAGQPVAALRDVVATLG